MDIKIRMIESAEEMTQVEEVQRRVWEGSETDVVPGHMLIAIVQHGGLVIGAFINQDEIEKCIGFVLGFPGFYSTPDGPRPMHCSHMLAVLPEYRDQGLGYKLKRAQWQMVRHQDLDRIVWTYDPLVTRNAHLNIAKLGAVCNTYLRNVYGEMRDDINKGLPSDRFQVDWWVNSNRAKHRLSKTTRRPLKLDDYLAADIPIINPCEQNLRGLPCPTHELSNIIELGIRDKTGQEKQSPALLLVEVPPDFNSLKKADFSLAKIWRKHTRQIFEQLFKNEYLVTDFVYSPAPTPRSFYVLSYGLSTL